MKALIFLLTVSLVYILSAAVVNEDLFSQSIVPYYNYLLNAFANGRLNVWPYKNATDLTFFNGNWYMYWGPAPAIFVAPFYLFFKTRTSDVFYTLTAGIINIFLFHQTLRSFIKAFNLKISEDTVLYTVTCFAFISPNFYLSLTGQVWHTNQIIATTYLLIFLLYYFKFFKSNNIGHLILSIIFFNLAILSRYTLVFHMALFIPLFIELRRKGLYFARSLFLFSLISLTFLSMFMAYNHMRFGNILETGTTYQNIRSSEFVYHPASHDRKLISLKYFPHNFYTYFLNDPKISQSFPFFSIDKEGLSMFSVYPVIALFPLAYLRLRHYKSVRRFASIALYLVVTPVLIYLLFFIGTGWAQFGLRYLFDILPLTYILTIIVIKRIPPYARAFLLLAGIYINVFGGITFYNIPF